MNKEDKISVKVKIIYWLIPVFVLLVSIPVRGEAPDKKVLEIHNRILTVDTHCDTPMAMLDDKFDVGVRNTPH